MASRRKYRKWLDPAGHYPENYLLIEPNGTMLQVSFIDDLVGVGAMVYRSTHKISPQLLLKYKEVCSKAEFKKALAKARGFTDCPGL